MSTIDLGHVTDDRGRETALRAITAAEHEAVVPTRVRRLLVIVICVFFAIPIALAIVSHWTRAFQGLEGLAIFALLIPTIAVASWYAYLQRPRRARQLIARARVARGLCGGCLYTLKGLEAAPDGSLVCPECGAAWRPPQPGPGA